MAKTATINTRIDPKTKKAAEAVFAKLGISASEAISIFYTQVGFHKAIPFSVNVPNKATRQAISESRKNRNVDIVESLDDLWKL
jgi:DNA-damage-inducible protein J